MLGLRAQYLEGLGRRESVPAFLQYKNSVEIDWTAIRARIRDEEEKERSRPGAKPYVSSVH